MNYWSENWVLWVSAFCVLSIYSYLISDNPVYRVMMQVFIGVNVGYGVVTQWRDVLYPRWWLPMVDGVQAALGRGTGSPWGLLWIGVGLLGLLWYFQLSRRYFWLSRIVIGITLGIGAGLTFKSQLGQNLKQVADSFKPLAPPIVAKAPRSVATLPGSAWRPALRDPVVFLVSGNELVCAEIYRAVEIWRASVPVPGAPELVDGLIRVGRSAWDDRGRLSRLRLEGEPERDVLDLPPGAPVSRARLEVDPDRIALRPLDEGAGALWERPRAGAEVLGARDGSLYLREGSRLLGLSLVDGSETFRADIGEGDLGLPALARFEDRQFDRTVLLVPMGAEVVAIAYRDNPSLRLRQGDVLWRARLAERPTGLEILTDHALVVMPAETRLWKLPSPEPPPDARELLDNWVFTLTMLSVMIYFFFSFRAEGRLVRGAGRLGRWMLMIGFGAFFGNTVMTRMSYLLDRLMFLIDDWAKPFVQYLLGR